MKSAHVIEERIQLLLREELQRRLQESQLPQPHHCKYNHTQIMDPHKTISGEINPNYNRYEGRVSQTIDGRSLPVASTVSLCLFKKEDLTICEDTLDAVNCVHDSFTPKVTQQEVYDQFVEDVSQEEWVLINLPRIHPLLWVLGSKSWKVEQNPPKLSLFERFKAWLYLSLLKPTDNTKASVIVYLPPPP